MPTIYILIEGVAVGYKHSNNWRVLFPYDLCHSAAFSYKRGNPSGSGSPVFVEHLGSPGPSVKITHNSSATIEPTTPEFDSKAFNLTKSTAPLMTHTRLAHKPRWKDKGIFLSIGKATFGVRNTLADSTTNGRIPFLRRPDGGEDPMDPANTAHYVQAEVPLRSSRETFTVKRGSRTLFDNQALGPNSNYTLIFNNDCDSQSASVSDMDLVYRLLGDHDGSNKQFCVIGRRPRGTKSKLEDNSITTGHSFELGDDKPCMFVYITNPTDLD